MSITGDIIIDYEMATPDEFIEYYNQDDLFCEAEYDE